MNDFMLKPISMSGLAETIGMSPVAEKLKARGINAPEMPEPSAEMRAAFFAEATPVLVRLEELCGSACGRQAAAEAHYLANGCLALGLDEGVALCREIERMAETDGCSAARAKVPALRKVLRASAPTAPENAFASAGAPARNAGKPSQA